MKEYGELKNPRLFRISEDLKNCKDDLEYKMKKYTYRDVDEFIYIWLSTKTNKNSVSAYNNLNSIYGLFSVRKISTSIVDRVVMDNKEELSSYVPHLKSTQIAKKEPTQTQQVAEKKKTQTGCIEGNCINGQGTQLWPNGSKYVGEWKKGKVHGQGTWTHPNGDKYVGEWKKHKYFGKGTYIYSNGDKYVGEWKKDKYFAPDNLKERHGQGTYTYINGDKYVGEWKKGKRQGKGIFTHADGKVEEGIWKKDKLIKPNG